MQSNLKRKHTQSGFTLVELSIVFIIFGLFLLGFILGLRVYIQTHNHNEVQASLENAMNALQSFQRQALRYPCPADPTLNPGDAGYGIEACGLTPVQGAPDADGNIATDNVLIGTLPISAMAGANLTSLRSLVNNQGLEGSSIDDPWNREFTYAVTQSLTTVGADFSVGAIRIIDEWGNDTGGTESDVQFVVVSHGEDSISGCEVITGTGPASLAEAENCDDDAVFSEALRSKSNTNHYDDYLIYSRSRLGGVWGNSLNADGTNSLTDNVIFLDQGKVFIGDPASYNQNNTNDLRLDIAGDIFVDTMIGADLICDDPNVLSTCIRPESLFVSDEVNNLNHPNLSGDFKCSGFGQYMKGVSINVATNELVPVCEDLEFAPALNGKECPPGMFLNGIYTDGEIACEDAPQP